MLSTSWTEEHHISHVQNRVGRLNRSNSYPDWPGVPVGLHGLLEAPFLTRHSCSNGNFDLDTSLDVDDDLLDNLRRSIQTRTRC